MTQTVAEIMAWSASDVREVFHAANSRAQSAADAADGIATLPALTTWGGLAAQAARESLARTQLDLSAHSREAAVIAAAARRAADNITKIQTVVIEIEDDAEDAGLQVNRLNNKVEPKPNATQPDRLQQNIMPLQERLNRIVSAAALLDMTLANTITMASGPAPIPAAPIPPPVPPPVVPPRPDGAAGLPPQRANEIRSVLEQLPKGSRPGIREVRSLADLGNLWDWLARDGADSGPRYRPPTSGTWKSLPDGSGVGWRDASSSTKSPAIDIKVGDQNWKVHINPRTGGVPVLPEPSPPPVARPPVQSLPKLPGLPRGFVGGGGMPDYGTPGLVELPTGGDGHLPIVGDGKPNEPDERG